MSRPEVGDLMVELPTREPRPLRMGLLVERGQIRDAEGVVHEIPMRRLALVPAMRLQADIARALYLAGVEGGVDALLTRAAKILVGEWYEPVGEVA